MSLMTHQEELATSPEFSTRITVHQARAIKVVIDLLETKQLLPPAIAVTLHNLTRQMEKDMRFYVGLGTVGKLETSNGKQNDFQRQGVGKSPATRSV